MGELTDRIVVDDMVPDSKLKEFLESFKGKYSKYVIKELKKGDRVYKRFNDLWYIIDDPNIDRRLGKFPDGKIPYKIIAQSLKGSTEELENLFGDSHELPFSKAFNLGLGQCLEKSILTQLAAQRRRDSFLINGILCKEDDKINTFNHAFNIVFKDGYPYLVDTQNPIGEKPNGDYEKPRIARILGISPSKHGELVLSDEWKKYGLIYSIF